MKNMNLVIQTAFLGDLILAIPLLQKIRMIHPETSLGIVCKKGLGTFLLDEKIVDHVFEIEKSNRNSYQSAISEIRHFNIDHLFCVHRSVRSQLMAAQIPAAVKVGFSSMLGFWVFDHNVDFLPDAPEAIRQMKILEPVSEQVRLLFISDEFSWAHDMNSELPDFFQFSRQPQLRESNRKIALFPGSVWNTKKWTVSGFRELSTALVSLGYEVDLCGSPDEIELCRVIASDLNGVNVRAGTMNVAQTVASLRDYDLVVSNDSAPTHMAAYKGTPVVTVFGPTTSRMGFRPWTKNARVVENNEMTCRPCGPHGHQECPLGHHNCMKTITAPQVLAAAQSLLPKA